MATTLNIVELVLGIAILYWGAEWLIRGSASLARAFGVKPLVIGLTVVAYGTSAPELAIATKTALAHSSPIALGTVIGSCAANISLILGITALIAPPVIDGRIIRREVPILLGSAIAVPLLLRNGVLSRVEGALLIICAVVFTVVTLTVSARLEGDDEDGGASDPNLLAAGAAADAHADADADADADAATASAENAAATTRAAHSGALLGGRARPRAGRGLATIMSVAGLLLLVFGSRLFVGGGRGIAAETGMSERMLGLTVIAFGTALPELIGSIIAARAGQASLAVGSVIGSNLLNVFLVLGVTAYLRPIRLGERMHVVDLVGLVAITLLGVIMLRGPRRISRVEGGILVAAYFAFITACALF